MKRFSFSKKKRLVSNEQFKDVLARSRRWSNGLLILYMAENDCGYSRLGVSVGKSRGNAVVRNRLKRLLREVFRQSQDSIPAGFDYLLMISPRWPKKSPFDSAQGEEKPSPLQGEQRPSPLQGEQRLSPLQGEEKPSPSQDEEKHAPLHAERRRGTKGPTFEQVRASFLGLVKASHAARRSPFDSAQSEEDNLHAERRRGTGHEARDTK